MSVPKSRRNEARTEYVWQAMLLASEVGAMCSRLPKRWAFTRTQFVIGAANRCMEEAVRANAIYATNEQEAAIRMGHLQEAMASAYVVEAYVNQIAEDNPKRPSDAGKEYADQRPCVIVIPKGELHHPRVICAYGHVQQVAATHNPPHAPRSRATREGAHIRG